MQKTKPHIKELKKVCIDKDMTLTGLARHLGVHPVHFFYVLHGHRESILLKKKIAEFANIPYEEFWGEPLKKSA